ncbi:ROK family protein, partial [Lactobacillus sp. XV13L]|nr:ROK family protein [Lactobacillus sp. XV13L]
MKLAVFDIGGTMVKTGYFTGNKLTKQTEWATPATFAGLLALMHRRVDGQEIT